MYDDLTVGKAADLYYEARQKRYEAQKDVERYRKEEMRYKTFLINELPKSDQQGAIGQFAKATIKEDEKYIICDTDKFCNFLKTQDNIFLFVKKEVKHKTVEDMLENGDSLPEGLDKMFVKKISINKL